MNRVGVMLSLFALSFAITSGGCQKASNQQSSSDTTSSSPENSKSAKKEKEAAPKEKPLVVPADTAIAVVLDEAISSKTAAPGDKFTATVEEPVEIEGQVAIPKDARATGKVKDVKAAGRFKGGALLELTLTSVEIHGKEHAIHTSAPTLTSKGKGKRTAGMVGGGAAGGAAIGAVAGGGKGAGIGALIGAAAGTGGAAFTGNRDIKLAAETSLTFKLVQPLEINR
jgi:hypothetical protein